MRDTDIFPDVSVETTDGLLWLTIPTPPLAKCNLVLRLDLQGVG